VILYHSAVRLILVRALVVLSALLMACQQAIAQCSMCRAVTGSNMYDDGFVGTGLNPAIIYLMVLPYILLSLVAFVFFRRQIAEKLRQWYGG
jgi:hypothetical protein